MHPNSRFVAANNRDLVPESCESTAGQGSTCFALPSTATRESQGSEGLDFESHIDPTAAEFGEATTQTRWALPARKRLHSGYARHVVAVVAGLSLALAWIAFGFRATVQRGSPMQSNSPLPYVAIQAPAAGTPLASDLAMADLAIMKRADDESRVDSDRSVSVALPGLVGVNESPVASRAARIEPLISKAVDTVDVATDETSDFSQPDRSGGDGLLEAAPRPHDDRVSPDRGSQATTAALTSVDRDEVPAAANDAGEPVAPAKPAAMALAEVKPVAETRAAVKIDLTQSDDAVWEGAVPTEFQEKLLHLQEGTATFASDVGKLTISGPAKIYLELPIRATLQLGTLEAELRDSLQIDTPFGLAAADGRVFIRSSIEGMSSLVRKGSLDLQGPSGARWLLRRGDFRLLTSTGQAFDWSVALDLRRDHRELRINGQRCNVAPRRFDEQVMLRLAAGVNDIANRARIKKRFDFMGHLRVNDVVRVFDHTSQLPVAFEAASQQCQIARLEIRTGKGPNARRRLVGGRDEAADLLAPKPLMPAALADGGMGVTIARVIRDNPFAASPRIQMLPQAALVAQLSSLPSIEVYRSNEEAVRMGRSLASISNVNAISVPPPREPLFEILPTRQDLQGLPYLRGGACRLPDDERNSMAMISRLSGSMGPSFLAAAMIRSPVPAQVPGMIQILQAKSHAERVALNHMLQQVGTDRAAENLAKRAIFDTSPQVRDLAVAGLRGKEEQVRPVLLAALRYPWPPAAMHAAEALVRLGDKPVVPKLVDLLDAPHPSTPVLQDGQWVMPEVVKINHMQNCMLCHPPSTSRFDTMRTPVPMPSQVLVRTPAGVNYGSDTARTNQAFVRADITYLRQDFSVTSMTRAYRPWPEEQRFDYLVRSRPLSAQELAVFRSRPPQDAYPQKRAVLFALQQLTGKRHVGDSGTWRASLLTN